MIDTTSSFAITQSILFVADKYYTAAFAPAGRSQRNIGAQIIIFIFNSWLRRKWWCWDGFKHWGKSQGRNIRGSGVVYFFLRSIRCFWGFSLGNGYIDCMAISLDASLESNLSRATLKLIGKLTLICMNSSKSNTGLLSSEQQDQDFKPSWKTYAHQVRIALDRFTFHALVPQDEMYSFQYHPPKILSHNLS